MDVLAEETVELSSSDPAKVAASLQRLIAIFNQRDPASLIVSLPSIAKVRAVSFAAMWVSVLLWRSGYLRLEFERGHNHRSSL